ncbi:glycosyl transferase, family 2 [Helicobacter heilmannii]|nr:glycosyl transferase, family 2 [Helicobacter heilmannii]
MSQKDSGIAEAFNKGVRLALVTYINFQGDGDGYLNHKALSQALEGVKGEW